MTDHVDFMGLPVTCSSAEALCHYNEGLRMLLRAEEGSVRRLQTACELDASLVLAHCLMACVWLSDLKPPDHPKVAPHVTAAAKAAAADAETLTRRERRHVEAVLCRAGGDLPRTLELWAAIIVEHPLDVLAIQMAFFACISLGEFERMRNLLAAAMVHWRDGMELYPHLASFYAFALEETNFRRRAEDMAREALAVEPRLCWATHTLGHVIEEEKDVAEGVELLTSTRSDWQDSVLSGHISWHLALYYLDLDDAEAALREFDTVLYDRVRADNLFGILDAASLLWRMGLLGMDAGDARWERVQSACAEHVDTHGLAFYNAHVMMGLAQGRVTETTARLMLANRLLASMAEYSKSGVSTNCTVVERIGLPTCRAFLAFSKGRYEEAASQLLPLRYDFTRLGGSWAQRQVFRLTLLQAAVRAGNFPLALALAAELRAVKPESRYLRRLVEQLAQKVTPPQPPVAPPTSTPPSAKRLKTDDK